MHKPDVLKIVVTPEIYELAKNLLINIESKKFLFV